MKRTVLTTLLAGGILAAALFNGQLTTDAMAQSARPAATPSSAGSYRHIVIFKFKDDAPKEKVDEIVKAFAALKDRIPSVLGFEWGTNVSPENLNQGFTHIFTVTFKDKESLEKGYLHHPEHVAFVEKLKPVLDKALVVDYVAQ